MQHLYLYLSLLTKHKLVLCYNGKHFSGSQLQKQGERTVAEEVIKALSALYQTEIAIMMAGRTDAGVHADGQVCSYKAKLDIPEYGIVKRLNQLLPDDIQVKSVEKMPLSFDARKSAINREYRFVFSKGNIPFYMQDFITKVFFSVDESLLSEFIPILVGTYDFRNFQNSGSKMKSTTRNILHFSLQKKTLTSLYDDHNYDVFEAKFIGNSFLYRMVRNIMGAIFEVLKGKQTVENFKKLLTEEYKVYRYTTAKPQGLCLVNVTY
ncbi:MAG: tRNA pseudouridine(38-40) synthase TruA [Candidatus Margulisbacteria bacterium]|nr:tRNA pseudouridine(38-40) synthase TruA [Candidatus Margulisiibacteriota bacterium]